VNALLAALALAAGADVAPRSAEPGTPPSAIFPLEWRLPEALWRPADGSEGAALPLTMPTLLAERFDAPQPWMQSFGDIVAHHRTRGGDRAALDAVLAELRDAAPALHARIGRLLEDVLDARALANPAWNPNRELRDDGIHFGPLLARQSSATEPWKSHSGARTFHQAVTFVNADLDAILGAIHDYATSFRDPGTSYERLEPMPDSMLIGSMPELGPFATLRVRVRSDLPFPFTHYDCDLRVLHSLEERTLVTDIYSPSADFRWFAGKDWYLPVRDSAGAWQGTLIVRMSGFDLSGVPDGDDDRMTGTRTALGSVRRRAEASFAASGSVPRTIDGAIPSFRATAPKR
jgi:hypothetical protein